MFNIIDKEENVMSCNVPDTVKALEKYMFNRFKWTVEFLNELNSNSNNIQVLIFNCLS